MQYRWRICQGTQNELTIAQGLRSGQRNGGVDGCTRRRSGPVGHGVSLSLAPYYLRMCGRYALAKDIGALSAEFDAEFAEALAEPAHRSNFNVAPGSNVPVVTIVGGVRILAKVRWGIVPKWSKNSSTLLINARGESVAEKVTFAKAFATRRILIPASGYYEWKRPAKDPYFISPPPEDLRIMPMAGLIADSVIDGQIVPTCAIITLAAAPNLELIHDRMPACISSKNWDAWLDPALDVDAALDLLVARPDLQSFPVDRAVNSVRNNSPVLIEELRIPD
jgi:putative SOS response-associated peptidase YedK